ncbi:hypothetical protein BGX31_003212 [Mortierella sp. GBA43]|nr:hypothetical protein BGX31_003212 [Mortierella sp. GBA43]
MHGDFYKLVLDDYIQRQEQLGRQDIGSGDISILTTLAKTGQVQEPTKYDLMYHLYKQCPSIQVRKLYFREPSYRNDSPGKFTAVLVEFVIPRTRHLHISNLGSNYPLKTSMIKQLLDHGFDLEELTILARDPVMEDEWRREWEQEGPNSLIHLKRLNLVACDTEPDSEAIWTWLWKRCGQVEYMEVASVKRVIDSLVEGMLTWMPNLNKIVLKYPDVDRYPTDVDNSIDNKIAAIVSGSRKGWKSMTLTRADKFGEAALRALAMHLFTLEKLQVLYRNSCFMDNLIRMISRCPNLHSLVMTSSRWTLLCHFKADTFVDRDPTTGVLRPWSCEASLKTLVCQIGGIPRPDLLEDPSEEVSGPDIKDLVSEAYPGQGRELQGYVLDRIARLSNLEILWLKDAYDFTDNGLCDSQFDVADCLEMSLESGLWKLSGLKELKELNVANMRTRIGIKEVQWMTENWPKLRAIYGIHCDHEIEVEEWLQEHHPWITARAN